MRGGPPDVNDGKREESRGPDELRRRSSRTDLGEVALIRQPDACRVFAIDGTAAEQPRIVCMGVHMMSKSCHVSSTAARIRATVSRNGSLSGNAITC
jgi:hypothetical protein